MEFINIIFKIFGGGDDEHFAVSLSLDNGFKLVWLFFLFNSVSISDNY